MAVRVLDEEPVRALAALAVATHAHEHPFALHALAFHEELEAAGLEGTPGIGTGQRRPDAAVPELHRTAAVLALRDRAFEVAVVERVVLHLDGEPLGARIERRPLGHGPGSEHA